MGLKGKNVSDIELLLKLLPEQIYKAVTKKKAKLDELKEIVMDYGRNPELRYANNEVIYLNDIVITQAEINHVVEMIGSFNADNRAGIEKTLHRISAIRNRQGKIIGLTCRVGRFMEGTINIVSDIIQSGKNMLILGGPGVGKTTKLREIARVLSTDYHKRVIIVDTSNEIAGDGDIPHPGIGLARRMQVSAPDQQHAVMIEAVENHMPEVIVVDEIGTEEEALAARTIAERGVQLVATAHGNSIENLLKNPTIVDLVGGIQAVILGDEEAKKRNSQKTILERKSPPTFEVLVEIHDFETVGIYHDIGMTVDAFLRDKKPKPEIRKSEADGTVKTVQQENHDIYDMVNEINNEEKNDKRIAIYSYAINRVRLERAIKLLDVDAKTTLNLEEADMVLTTKSHNKPNSPLIKTIQGRKIPIHVIKTDNNAQINKFLKYVFKLYNDDEEQIKQALSEIEEVMNYVANYNKPSEATAAGAYIRRLQRQICLDKGFRCESIGEEPNRRVRVYPQDY